MKDLILFSASSNIPLARELAKTLKITLGNIEFHKFSNNETRVRLSERVKGEICLVIGSMSTPVDENWVEILFLIDALKRRGAKKIIGIIPWLGYQKQDQAFREGECVSVAVVAKTLEAVGMDKMITFDLHSPQIIKYFSIPVTVLSAFPLFLEEIKKQIHNSKFTIRDSVMVAPDNGAYWAKDFAKKLGIDLVKIDKTRDKVSARVTLARCDLDTERIKGKTCFIIDDNIYTGATLIANAKYLKSKGAKKVICFVTHPILSGNACKLIQNSEIDSLTITDTILVPKEKIFPKLKIISIIHLLSQTLASQGETLRSLIKTNYQT